VSWRPSALLLALLLAGCDDRSLVVGESSASSGFDGAGRSNEPRCADAAILRANDEECWPTRHVGHWRGLVTGDARYRHVLAQPFEFPSDEVLLDIDLQGTGTLLFSSAAGDGASCAGDAGASSAELRADAGVGASDAGALSCRASDGGVQGGPQPGLVLDHRYSLDGLGMQGSAERERRQDRLVTFSLLIAAPWRELCTAPPLDPAASPCSCNADGCDISSETLQVSLSLSRDGEALRGSIYSSNDAALAAGLELVRR
jgi:hypothetical protein